VAVVALLMALKFGPAHVNETPDPGDNLGGILSALLMAALTLAIDFAPVPKKAEEERLLAEYLLADAGERAGSAQPEPTEAIPIPAPLPAP
jgi:hypothetical protein